MSSLTRIRAGRLATGFDVAPLIRAVNAVPEPNWTIIVDGDEWQSWTGIALRSSDGQLHTMVEGESYADTALVQQCQGFRDLLDFFQCPVHRARVLRLEAGGGTIHEHADEMPPGPPLARLHLPLCGAETTDFASMDVRVPMAVGELWFVDVTRPHCVVNRGQSQRLTVVIDCEVNDWLDQLIATSDCQIDALASGERP